MFNLAAPTPVMNGVDRAETEESEKATKLTEKEENNNKKNKRPLEEEKGEDTRKKAAIEGGPKPIPSFGGNSDFSPIGGSPKAEKVTSGGSSKLEAAPVNLTFTFRTPTTVITQVVQYLTDLLALMLISVYCRLQNGVGVFRHRYTVSPSPRLW